MRFFNARICPIARRHAVVNEVEQIRSKGAAQAPDAWKDSVGTFTVGLELGSSNNYWSSSEYSSTNARNVNTSNGNVNNNNKNNGNYVRAFARL